jgi:integrase
MARQSGIWRRTRDGWYMTTVNGKQVKLALDKKEASKAFHELMARPDVKPAGTSRVSFRKLADRFLDHCKRTMAEKTYVLRKLYLQQFCDYFGRKAVADLRVEHVTSWEEKHPQWSPSTRTGVRSIILACLNWGAERGTIPANPIPRLKNGTFARRERILTADERVRIRAEASKPLRDFLEALELTGARPYSEIGSLTADMIDFENGIITFEKHKNARKGKRRVIYITPKFEALLRRLVAKHPNGLLFRTQKGGEWTADALCYWMRELEDRLQIPRLTCYTWRHSFCTDALARGLTADVVGELVGNSARTVSQHYAHLEQQKAAMKAAAARALG